MTKQQHTAEPWQFDHSAVYKDGARAGDGRVYLIGASREVNSAIAEANARRIVACVNACAGIPTEALESGALVEFLSGIGSFLALAGAAKSRPAPAVVQAQRDRLAKLHGET